MKLLYRGLCFGSYALLFTYFVTFFDVHANLFARVTSCRVCNLLPGNFIVCFIRAVLVMPEICVTQRFIAENSGVSQTYLSNYVNGIFVRICVFIVVLDDYSAIYCLFSELLCIS